MTAKQDDKFRGSRFNSDIDRATEAEFIPGDSDNSRSVPRRNGDAIVGRIIVHKNQAGPASLEFERANQPCQMDGFVPVPNDDIYAWVRALCQASAPSLFRGQDPPMRQSDPAIGALCG